MLEYTQIKYEPHLVGFLDILGFSNKICESNSDEWATNYFANVKAEKGFNNLARELDIHIVSDSLIISELFHPSDDVNFQRSKATKFFSSLCEIQCRMHQRGYLIRGGVAFGSFFKGESIMVGPALIRAIELEKIAKLPLILFDLETCDSEIVTEVINSKIITSPVPPILGELAANPSKYYLLNSLEKGLLPDDQDASNQLIEIIELVKKGLSGDEEHHLKYGWLGCTLHRFLKNKTDSVPKNRFWENAFVQINAPELIKKIMETTQS
jgi:hypothetical protein